MTPNIDHGVMVIIFGAMEAGLTVDTYRHLIPGANRKAVNALDDPGWERASGKPIPLAQSAICIGAENNA